MINEKKVSLSEVQLEILLEEAMNWAAGPCYHKFCDDEEEVRDAKIKSMISELLKEVICLQ